jgi:hypothetical protein
MLYEIALKLLSVVCVVGIFFLLYTFQKRREKRKQIDAYRATLESAEYDKNEWKKIKQELAKK